MMRRAAILASEASLIIAGMKLAAWVLLPGW